MSRPLSSADASADREDDRHGDGAAEPVRRQPDDEDLAREVHERRDREVEAAAAADDRGRARHRGERHRREVGELVAPAEVRRPGSAMFAQQRDREQDGAKPKL